MRGVTIIICCYNSQERIIPTLEHIARQQFSNDLDVELLVVDNNSTDSTIELVEQTWQKNNNPFLLRIIKEPQQGTGHARRCGLKNTRNDYVLFVDDDNHLDSYYVEQVVDILDANLEIAACGGGKFLPNKDTYDLPVWWNDFKHVYVVGERFSKAKFVSELATAGMGLRMSAYNKLIDVGFQYILSGRKGNELLAAGEDYELCYALQLRGYKIYYSPKLQLAHAISNDRINIEYLTKMYRGNGITLPYLSAYFFTLKRGKHNWFKQLLISYFLLTAFSIGTFVFYIFRNKRNLLRYRMKIITTLERLRTLMEVSPEEYNKYCKTIYQLKQ